MKKTCQTTERRKSALLDSTTPAPPRISPEALAILGDGKIAYIRKVTAAQVKSEFPQAPHAADDAILYALHQADGTPVMLTDSREAAVANAWAHELEAVSVH